MGENKNDFVRWIKEHKTQLLLAGISIAAISAILFRIRDQENFENVWKKLKESINFKKGVISEADLVPEVSNIQFDMNTASRTYTRPRLPVDVARHIRNLPNDRCHSAEKAMEAADLRIPLLPGQTIVDSYTKYSQAA